MRRLNFFKGAQCEACEEQEPIVQAFESKHMGAVMVIRLNPNLKEYTLPFDNKGGLRGKRVTLTPSFSLYEGVTPLRQREGDLLSAEQLEAFVFDDHLPAIHGAPTETE